MNYPHLCVNYFKQNYFQSMQSSRAWIKVLFFCLVLFFLFQKTLFHSIYFFLSQFQSVISFSFNSLTFNYSIGVLSWWCTHTHICTQRLLSSQSQQSYYLLHKYARNHYHSRRKGNNNNVNNNVWTHTHAHTTKKKLNVWNEKKTEMMI